MALGGEAGLGLFGGSIALLAGRWALERGRRSIASGGPAATLLSLVAVTLAPLAVALAAVAQGYSGAALGVVAGAFVLNALVAAPLAVFGAAGEAKGARRVATVSALAAAAMIWAAYNGEVSAFEGSILLLAAAAVAGFAARSAPPPAAAAAPSRPLVGSAWFAGGVVLILAAAWGIAFGTGWNAAGRPDGDLMIGLSLVALAAALPNAVIAWRAGRAGAGGSAFVELTSGQSVMLFAALGAAAMLRPMSAPESFLGFPALALAASALALLGLALGGLRATKPMLAVSIGAYALFLWAFVRGVA